MTDFETTKEKSAPKKPRKNNAETRSSVHVKKESTGKETLPMQAEMRELLHIIIHSLYAERDVFLREIVSNAADALHKVRYQLQSEQSLRDADAELEIEIEVNAAEEGQKTIAIHDNGIGMTREELITNLGSIAHSGTRRFVQSLANKQKSNAGTKNEQAGEDSNQPGEGGWIGQFGVGFYAAFMVAKQVVVDSCPADPNEPATRWVCDGGGEYSLARSDKTTRGTTVTIHLHTEQEEYASDTRLEGIVQRYSNFIPYPIRIGGNRINTQEAIWSRPRSEVKAEEHQDFYTFLSSDSNPLLHTLQIAIEAPMQYKALLYVPTQLSDEVLYSPTPAGLDLYSSHVLISKGMANLLPIYLRFLRGVVDTQDLPLNVSRDVVQKDPLLTKLRESLTGRVLRDLQQLSEKQPDLYLQIWHAYGAVLKEGIAQDAASKDKLQALLRFDSSACPSQAELTHSEDNVTVLPHISLKTYLDRMPPEQTDIYYLYGASRTAIEHSPLLEHFHKKGWEVLYLYQPVDPFILPHLTEFEGKKLIPVEQADVEAEIPPADKATENSEDKDDKPDFSLLLEWSKQTLGDKVQTVQLAKRFMDSPAVLVNSKEGMPAHMQQMIRQMGHDFQAPPQVLELNSAHPLIESLNQLATHQPNTLDNPLTKAMLWQLFDNCLLLAGEPPDPRIMVNRIYDLMQVAADNLTSS